MSDVKKDNLAALLSPSRDGMKLVNVKFFRGEREYIRPDDFRAQLRAVAEQRKNGAEPMQGAPRSTKKRINVREFVSAL